MSYDGSCPKCKARPVGRAEFTYAHEGDALCGLTCMASCPACHHVWIEVYRLAEILDDRPAEAVPATPDDPARRVRRLAAPLAFRTARREQPESPR